MCIYLYTYIYLSIYLYLSLSIHLHIHICTYIYIYTQLCTNQSCIMPSFCQPMIDDVDSQYMMSMYATRSANSANTMCQTQCIRHDVSFMRTRHALAHAAVHVCVCVRTQNL